MNFKSFFRVNVKVRTERRNWTELIWLSFWRAVLWTRRGSPLVIGWRVPAVSRCLL